MSTYVERIFGSTLQTTERWLIELMDELETEDPARMYRALRGVLHATRDRLPANEALHLSAQLPMLLRGLYFEGWDPKASPEKLGRIEFLDQVGDLVDPSRPEAEIEPVVRAVFRLLSRHISAGELDEVRGALPRSLASLWPPPREAHEPESARH